MFKHRKITSDDLDSIRLQLSLQKQKLSDEPVCDFCGDPHPVYIFAAIRMLTGEWRANWRWLACEDCKESILARNFTHIEDKLISWLKTRFPHLTEPELRIVSRHALQSFHWYARYM